MTAARVACTLSMLSLSLHNVPTPAGCASLVVSRLVERREGSSDEAVDRLGLVGEGLRLLPRGELVIPLRELLARRLSPFPVLVRVESSSPDALPAAPVVEEDSEDGYVHTTARQPRGPVNAGALLFAATVLVAVLVVGPVEDARFGV